MKATLCIHSVFRQRCESSNWTASVYVPESSVRAICDELPFRERAECRTKLGSKFRSSTFFHEQLEIDFAASNRA